MLLSILNQEEMARLQENLEKLKAQGSEDDIEEKVNLQFGDWMLIIRENALKQNNKKNGSKFNPGLTLIGHRTTGPIWFLKGLLALTQD